MFNVNVSIKFVLLFLLAESGIARHRHRGGSHGSGRGGQHSVGSHGSVWHDPVTFDPINADPLDLLGSFHQDLDNYRQFAKQNPSVTTDKPKGYNDNHYEAKEALIMKTAGHENGYREGLSNLPNQDIDPSKLVGADRLAYWRRINNPRTTTTPCPKDSSELVGHERLAYLKRLYPSTTTTPRPKPQIWHYKYSKNSYAANNNEKYNKAEKAQTTDSYSNSASKLFAFFFTVLIIICVVAYCHFTIMLEKNANKYKFNTTSIECYKIEPGNIKKEVKIDHGNEGAVFVAFYTPLKSKHTVRVALKKIKQENDEFDGHDIVREIELLGNCCKHPNIVRLIGWYSVEPDHDQLVIVTEYLSGGTLECFIQENGPLHWSFPFPIFKQICDTMCFLTKTGIVHRDLAPRNLMFTDKTYRQLKLIDFGLCRRVGNLQISSDHSRSHRKNKTKGKMTNQTKQKGLPTLFTPSECIAARQMLNQIRANGQQSGTKMIPDSFALIAPEFNEKTDVWAFGVIIWYCLAPASSWKELRKRSIWKKLANFLQAQLAKLMQMSIQQAFSNVPENQTLVKPCLALNVMHRPTFKQLSAILDQINDEYVGIVDERRAMI